MDEDENNLATNSPRENAEETHAAFEDDDALLDTIEVTVTTDGAPLTRTEDIEIINLAGSFPDSAVPSNQNQANENSPTGNVNVSPQNNTNDSLHSWSWENEEIDDAANLSTSNAVMRAHAFFSAMLSSSNAVEGAASSSDHAGALPSYCFDISSVCARTRKDVAAIIVAECCSGGPTPDLNYIMERFFNPSIPIDNPDNISWIRWLIAGGRTISNFVKIGK